MSEERRNKPRKPKADRQEWNPNFLLQVLYRVWRVVFVAQTGQAERCDR